MERDDIPDEVRRFVLTSIPSVPYLEALLLLRNEPQQPWDGKRLARRLYMGEKAAAQLLTQLHEAGLLAAEGEADVVYSYHPADPGLEELVAKLAHTYARKLVQVSNLIHARNGKRAQHFADAFVLRKEP